MSLCEAAHIPVIWATQVLERLAKTGRPSRAEISDATLAQRAECVMLNKGWYIVETIRALASIVRATSSFQSKRTHLLDEMQFDRPDPEEVGRGVGTR